MYFGDDVNTYTVYLRGAIIIWGNCQNFLEKTLTIGTQPTSQFAMQVNTCSDWTFFLEMLRTRIVGYGIKYKSTGCLHRQNIEVDEDLDPS